MGDGLLSAAVAGTIFASPSAEQIRRAILGRVEKGRGVLVVVMNYTVRIFLPYLHGKGSIERENTGADMA